MLPPEVQGYIRHILHAIGVAIVGYGGMQDSNIEMYVGLGVNLISLGWFLYAQIKSKR